MNRRLHFWDQGIALYKRNICLFAGAGFAGGIVLANTFGKKLIRDLGIFGDYFFMQMQQVKIDAGRMFWYVFEKRILFIFALLLFGVTSFGCIAVYVMSSWIGSSIGFLLSAAVMQNGAKGLSFCMMGLFPQMLFYIPAGFLLLLKTCQLSDRLYERDRNGMFHKKKELIAYAVMAAGVTVVFLIGITTESLLNPVLLQKIYNFFNNM